MSDIDPLLDSIEESPSEDFPWSVLADWLEERSDPLSEVLRETIEARMWVRGLDRVSHGLPFRQAQLLACDAVEPALPIVGRRYPTLETPRRLLEGLRLGPTSAGLRALNKSFVTHLRGDLMSAEAAITFDWTIETATECVVHLLGWPRRSCIQAAHLLASEGTGLIPSRLLSKKDARTLRLAIEVECRRLIVKAIRRHLDSPGP